MLMNIHNKQVTHKSIDLRGDVQIIFDAYNDIKATVLLKIVLESLDSHYWKIMFCMITTIVLWQKIVKPVSYIFDLGSRNLENS